MERSGLSVTLGPPHIQHSFIRCIQELIFFYTTMKGKGKSEYPVSGAPLTLAHQEMQVTGDSHTSGS